MPQTQQRRRSEIVQGPMMFPAAPLTKNEAMIYSEFHYTGTRPCQTVIGPRGGTRTILERWLANGAMKERKSWAPENFELPLKYSIMTKSSYHVTIDEQDVVHWHPAYRCPAGLH